MDQGDISIGELIAKIARDEIRLPLLQRRYVWSDRKVRDFLDSLYRGYPSGTILMWETDENVEERNFAFDQKDDVRQRTYQFLLDGQQRLTSLCAVLQGSQVRVPVRIQGKEKYIDKHIDILFNLEHSDSLQVFTPDSGENNTNNDLHVVASRDGNKNEPGKPDEKAAFKIHQKKDAKIPRHWVSVTEVFKERRDTPFLKQAGITSMDDRRHDEYTKKLNKLRGIENYAYRVQILERAKSYEEVAEIFVRLNSKGSNLQKSGFGTCLHQREVS